MREIPTHEHGKSITTSKFYNISGKIEKYTAQKRG